MSAQQSDGNGPNGGKEEEGKQETMAQVVGAEGLANNGGNIRQHADEEENWFARPTGGRKESYRFGGKMGIPNSQDEE